MQYWNTILKPKFEPNIEPQLESPSVALLAKACFNPFFHVQGVNIYDKWIFFWPRLGPFRAVAVVVVARLVTGQILNLRLQDNETKSKKKILELFQRQQRNNNNTHNYNINEKH